MNMKKTLGTLFLFLALATPVFAQTGTLLQDKVTIVKAKVLDIISQEVKQVPGTDVSDNYQNLKVLVLEGDEKGNTITLNNDYLSLKKGETFYMMITVRADNGAKTYGVSEVYRLPAVIFFVVLFIVLVFLFGGIQGIRGLLSLCGSFLLILYVLLPGILHGYSPILMSIGVSALIIIVGSYITHGFNKTTTSAVIGMVVTVMFTGILAYIAVHWARLSGFSNEEAVYLNLDTRGSIDFVGLLLGGILIGLLGVLYDVAIGQAISVEELHHIAPHLPRSVIYKRAIRIGREHIGALVNTLAIAYVGVSLPLLLLYVHSSTGPISQTINREVFATEIIRTLIGSIGLVVAVPITTIICILILMRKKKGDIPQEKIEQEKKALEHFEHHH